MTVPVSRSEERPTDAAASVRAYESALRSYFARRVDNVSEVDDLVQEAFARMLAANPSGGMHSPIAYLFRIAANLLTDRARRRGKARASMTLAEDELAMPPTQEDFRREADLRTAYAAALSELPARCQRVFVLRRHDEATTPQIAAELGISHRMVQKYLARALSHLHARLRHFVEEG